MKKLPIVVIACRVLQDLLTPLIPEDLAAQVTYTDYGLHRHPSRLNKTVQDAIDSINEPSLVVLGYGLCGDGLNGIRAGKHTLLIPRVDDCIALLLGSYQVYRREFDAVPGTYYLSKGWLESDDHPLKEYEEYVEKYGPKDAVFVMDMQYQHYERLVFVIHNHADLEKYRPLAQEVARYCERWGMRYEEILGSDAFMRRLVEVAVVLEKADEDFLIISAGGEIRQAHFLR
ncbi:MAG: DUF1638 domain-containing protein [Deltaproteobacteria bacterium]|nr:MAG: DUF1638 domain-containing protein [Deltaproteobacteria bacterium]